MPDFPHQIHTDARVCGDLQLLDGAKLGHWPYTVVRDDTQLEVKHRGQLILVIADAPVAVTLPALADAGDAACYRIRHFGGNEVVIIRGAGGNTLDNNLDSIQIAPGGWYDCVAISEVPTWALVGNDRIIDTENAVREIRDNEVVEAVPGGFYNLYPRSGPATLTLGESKNMPGAFVYIYVVQSSPEAPAVIRATGNRNRIEGRNHQAAEFRAAEYKFEGGRSWAMTLRSDGTGYWVIV